MGIGSRTSLSLRKTLGCLEQPASVPAPLHVIPNRDATKYCDRIMHIHANNANRTVSRPEKQRVVVRRALVGMIGVICRAISPELEQDTPADCVIRCPIRIRSWRSQVVDYEERPDVSVVMVSVRKNMGVVPRLGPHPLSRHSRK